MSTTTRRNFLKSTSVVATSLLVAGPGMAKTAFNDTKNKFPHYKSGAPMRTNLRQGVLNAGQSLRIKGLVKNAGTKSVIPGATVEIWHASPKGRYDFTTQFKHRGAMECGIKGAYSFQTVMPGHTKKENAKQARRVFLKISAPGHATQLATLYFDEQGLPYIDGKLFANGPWVERPCLPVMQKAGGEVVVTFNIYMRGAGPQNILGQTPSYGAIGLTMYPNPITNGTSYLKVSGLTQVGAVAVEVFDTEGKQVHSLDLGHISNNKRIKLDMGRLPKGQYVARIYGQKFGVQNRKFVVA